jgi:hypothetical protein
MNHNHANFLTNESSYKIVETNNQYDQIDDDETQDTPNFNSFHFLINCVYNSISFFSK